jgi:hypothetical protein
MSNHFDQRYQQIFGNQYNAGRDIIFQITPPLSAFEKLWLNFKDTWPMTLPFHQTIFDRIKDDVKTFEDYPAVAILRHIGGNQEGLFNFPEFSRIITNRYGRLSNDDRIAFMKGYQVIQILCTVAFMAMIEGIQRATSTFVASSIQDHFKPMVLLEIPNAARLVSLDISSRNMMTVYGENWSQTDNRYGNEGVLTSADTFMVYSKIWEEYHLGNLR